MNAPANNAAKTVSTRHDGWTSDRRRNFLELLAEGHTIEAACAHVGMSKVTAYALRRRDSAFALAWGEAVLQARDTVADTLTNRAITGQAETITRADGSTFTRHRFDSRLGLALLARLDRLAAQPGVSVFDQPDEAAFRAAAHALDTLVDLVGQGDIDADAAAAFIEPYVGELRKLRGEEPAHADAGAEKQPHPRELRKLRMPPADVIPDLIRDPASSDGLLFVANDVIHARRGEGLCANPGIFARSVRSKRIRGGATPPRLCAA